MQHVLKEAYQRYERLAQELIAREEAKKNLIEFVKYTKPDFEVGEHHLKIVEALECLERGEIKRLMIFAPPRHTKSELTSRRFVSWYMGRNPKSQIISATYSGDFALDFGRDVRNIVNDQTFQNIFIDVALASDSKAANRWHTNQGGVYVSVGVGGAITGRGAHLGLIDDPFKNRQEADSEVTRETVWNWYTSTFYTRLMPQGAIIVICTRWHEDDLAGRLLEAQKHGGDQWHVVNLPALNEVGEALWPQWYNKDKLLQIKNVIGHRDWSALYMQQPTAEEGTYFKREWFENHRYETLPPINHYMSSDYAVTEDGGDATEHGVLGLAENSHIYVIDWWDGKTTADKWIDVGLDLVKKHQPFTWFGEAGPLRRAIEPFLKKRMDERQIYCRCEWLTRAHDKVITARALQAMASLGKVHFPKHAPWADRVIDQLTAFPAGKHDDAVDVLSLFAMALDESHPGIRWDIESKANADPWDKVFNDTESDESWRTM